MKDLESDKLVIRKSYNEIPPKVEYSLSEDGKGLVSVIKHINEWGAEYMSKRIRENMEQS